MSAERNLISKILHERDLSVSSDAGVSPDFFQDHEHRQAYEMIMDHQATYGKVPTLEAFQRDYPSYRLSSAEDAMAYYVDMVVKDYASMLLEDGLVQATDLFDDGHEEESQQVIAKTLQRLNQETSRSKVVDITQTVDERLKRYKTYSRKESALKGISTGFDFLDAATGGYQKKQLVTMVGPPKAGKSTMMLLCALAAHRGFFRPLFIGFEMTNEEQEERHDAIRAQISATRLRDGELRREEMQRLERMARRLDSMPMLAFSEDTNSSLTLSGVAAQIDKYQPNCLFVDGTYMMEDEFGERKGSPQALTNLTRGFKRMAQNFDIPVCISTQVLEWKMDRKRGVTTASIGYTSSFGQDSDILIGVEKTDDEMINKVKILDGRNVPRMEQLVLWDWDNGTFTELDAPAPEGGEGETAEAGSKF